MNSKKSSLVGQASTTILVRAPATIRAISISQARLIMRRRVTVIDLNIGIDKFGGEVKEAPKNINDYNKEQEAKRLEQKLAEECTFPFVSDRASQVRIQDAEGSKQVHEQGVSERV
jgi:preprotein translocase subunit SecF